MVRKTWQARRDSNPQPPDLESGALAVRATGLQANLYIIASREDVKENVGGGNKASHPIGVEKIAGFPGPILEIF